MSRRLASAVVVAAWAFGRSIVTPKATRPVQNPRSVLIIQLAKLGDMVCTTPLFRAIKQRYPDCRITVLGNRTNAALLAGHPNVDQYLTLDRSFIKTIVRLRTMQFDFGCLTAPDFIGLAFLILARIPTIAAPSIVNGVSPYETAAYVRLRRHVIPIPHRMGSYAPREYLRLLEPMGIRTDDTTKSLTVSAAAAARVGQLLRETQVDPTHNFLVGIAPSVGNAIKRWPVERFSAVADFLAKQHRAIICITGAAADAAVCQAMVDCLQPGTRWLNTCGQLDLEELKALVARLHLFVSVDTGVIYIAEALGTPTVDIVGPMDEREQPPIGPFHATVTLSDRAAPALHIMNVRAIDPQEARRQIEGITPAMVTKVIDELIPHLPHSPHTP